MPPACVPARSYALLCLPFWVEVVHASNSKSHQVRKQEDFTRPKERGTESNACHSSCHARRTSLPTASLRLVRRMLGSAASRWTLRRVCAAFIARFASFPKHFSGIGGALFCDLRFLRSLDGVATVIFTDQAALLYQQEEIFGRLWNLWAG